MDGPAGQTYAGRTSGYGDPNKILKRRTFGHHMKGKGYGNPLLDRAAQGWGSYTAIRGREQQLIDYFGGIGSPNVGNTRRGVSASNPFGRSFHNQSNLFFGQLAPYTGN